VSDIDPRTKAGAFGEKVKGPHKPTLDEIGPHAMLPVKSGKAPPPKPTRTIEEPTEKEKKGRRGRPRKRPAGRGIREGRIAVCGA
jgi:excinuclease ABC subunit B